MTKPKSPEPATEPEANAGWDTESERALWADVCLKDFWWFCDYAMGYGTNPAFKWWTKRVHRPFCNWFQQHVLAWLARRHGDQEKAALFLMVVVMREFGKTMIVTKAGQMWLHLHDPDLSTYTGSSTVTRAQGFFDPIKTAISGGDPFARFAWLYGNWYNRDRAWTAFDVVHGARISMSRGEPSLGTWGVETGLTGTHPDGGFMDDPIDYEIMGKDSRWLGKVNTHLVSLTPVFKANSIFVYTGTRYHDADAIGEQLRKNGCASTTGMAMTGTVPSPDGLWHVYFMRARADDGTPTFPENWPESRLKNFQRNNSLIYSSQMLNDPNTGAHIVLTASQIESLWVERRHVPSNCRWTVHIDTAFKSREAVARGDENVIQVWAHDLSGTGDVYYMEGYGSNRWNVSDFNDQLIILLQRLRKDRHWPSMLTDEQEVGGKYGTWEMTLQSWCHGAGMPAPVIKLLPRSGKSKVGRILQAATYWVDGHVRLVRQSPGSERLVDQMLRIGTSAQDDWADCGADVFHSEVYRPARITGLRDEQPQLARPWDAELQNGTLTEEDLELIHRATLPDRGWTPDPIT